MAKEECKIHEVEIELEKVDNLTLEVDDYDEIVIEEQGEIIVETDKNYLHKQTVPSKLWVIKHDLGKYPAVSIMDSAKNEVVGEVIYHDKNTLTTSFMGEFSGIATLN